MLPKQGSGISKNNMKTSLESPVSKISAKQSFYTSLENLGIKDSPRNISHKAKLVAFGDCK